MGLFVNFHMEPETRIFILTAHKPGNHGLVGIPVSFENEAGLITALESAGIGDDRYKAPLNSARSGYGTNITISLEEARKLNILLSEDE